MSYTLSVALNLARAYLNDNNAVVWTDTILIPKSQEAYRELGNRLWVAGCPVMRSTTTPGTTITAGTTPTDITAFAPAMMNPIALYEAASTAGTYIPMTEIFNLPSDYVPKPVLTYWYWKGEKLFVAPASANRVVAITFRVLLTTPALVGDTIFIPFSELYLGARTAAIAAGSVGNKPLFSAMSAKAKENLNAVVAANRGQTKSIINP